jgi:hypothetical protein
VGVRRAAARSTPVLVRKHAKLITRWHAELPRATAKFRVSDGKKKILLTTSLTNKNNGIKTI